MCKVPQLQLMQTCSSPRHCFSETSASANASIREPWGAASPELGDSPWHHSILLLNMAANAYSFIFFFLMPLHRTTAVFYRKLDVKDTQVWACAMDSCHAAGEQAASCLPCPAALLHCSCKQCPKCAEPSGVWKDSLPALSRAPAWLPQNTESRALLSSKGLCPSPAHHEAAFHSSLPSDPLALWQDQTVNRVLARDVKKQYGNGLQNCFFFLQDLTLSSSCKHGAVIISETEIQAGSAEPSENT